MNITIPRAVIEQALEALNYVMRHGPAVQKAKDILQDALAQPEQEPVAWQWLDTGHFRKKIPADATPAHWRPLYIAPPQRQPLTEEEINRIDGATPFHEDTAWLIRFARAIERAHGIGGGDEN